MIKQFKQFSEGSSTLFCSVNGCQLDTGSPTSAMKLNNKITISLFT